MNKAFSKAFALLGAHADQDQAALRELWLKHGREAFALMNKINDALPGEGESDTRGRAIVLEMNEWEFAGLLTLARHALESELVRAMHEENGAA